MRRPSTFTSVSPLVLFSLAFAGYAQAQAAQPGSAGSPAEDANEARARSLEVHNSISGSTGLLRILTAESGASGTFRLHVMADWFTKSSFLCSADHQCPIEPHTADDSASRIGSSIGMSVTLLDYLEAFASIRSYSNSNDRSRPQVFQVIGDANLGVKAFTPNQIGELFKFGGAADLMFRGASGGTGFQPDATGLRLRALGSFDLRKPTNDNVPLRIHANVGYLLDNSDNLITDVENKRQAAHDPRGRTITRVERFGLNINRMDQVTVGLGIEGMLSGARPFIEYNLGIPVNRQGYTCDPNYTSQGDQCMGGGRRGNAEIEKAGFSSFPSTLTLGVRFFPWLRGLSATAAFDIGTSGTSTFVEELAPTPVWDLWFGAGYAYDTEQPAAKVSVEKVALAPRAELKIRGLVHEKDKTDPIGDATVHIEGRELSGMATDPDGRFMSSAVEPGSYTFAIHARGYKDGQCAATVSAPPEPPVELAAAPTAPPPIITDVDCALEASPRIGSLSGRVFDADGMAPVMSATVKVVDSEGKELGSAVTDSIGAFIIDSLPPGAVIIKVEATDYVLRAQDAEVRLRQDSKSDVLMQKRAAKGDVEVAGKEIRIKKQILFETASSRINPTSAPLVDEIADVMNRNPQIRRIEIQGHTDNTGSKDQNKTLSEQRANAVRDALISRGVQAERLTAVGYGQEKTIASNATAQGREKNRRVQFVILEQEKPAAAAKPAADKPAADKPKPAADKPKPAAKP